MGLRGYLTKRIVYSFILLFFIIGLNFIIFRLMPGDPTDLLVNPLMRMAPEERERYLLELRDLWGLEQPLHVQFSKYVSNLFTWQFGKSIWNQKDVAQEMLWHLPYTLELMGLSIVFAIIIGVIIGVYAAQKRGGLFDSSTVLVSMFLYSLPVFWLGLVLVLIFSAQLGILPAVHAQDPELALLNLKPWTLTSDASSGALNVIFSLNPQDFLRIFSNRILHAILPVGTLTIFQYGGFLLLSRATMIESLTEDYVITARAKGLKERHVLFKHALKNASLPLITSAAITFGFMLSGAIITETVFTWPGLGGWIWAAITIRDYPVLMAIFYVIALCVIVANLIADVLYGIIDPRIKYG